MKRVLIVNAYSVRNRGDAGIVVGMIKYIRDICPNVSISVMSSYHKENEAFYAKYDVQSVPALWALRPGTPLIYRYGMGVLLLLIALLNPASSRFRVFRDSDIVLGAGGGYLYSSRRGALGVGLLSSLFHYWIAKRVGKQVVGFPESVGPLNHWVDRCLTGAVLRRLDLFISRERLTSDVLSQLRVEHRKEYPDVAFYLARPPTRPLSDLALGRTDIKIGLTALDWRFAVPNASWADIELYLEKLAATIAIIKERVPSVSVAVFPQVDVGGVDSDVPVSKRLVELIGEDCAEYVNIPEMYGPEELIELYGQMDLFVASRMHSAIFALDAGVPAIGLGYQPKMRGTFELLGLGRYVLDVQAFESSELAKLALEALGPMGGKGRCAARSAKAILRGAILMDLPRDGRC
jgi:colanic acid/amylovoran biosynthesis protein